MKKIIFFLTLLFMAFNSFSQPPTDPKNLRDYYDNKSKNQTKVANIFLIGGGVCILTAILIPRGAELPSYGFATYENTGVKSTFAAIGLLSMLTSIPFYIVSSSNKKKAIMATKISLNNQRILFPQQNAFVFKTQPSLTLTIGL